MSSSDDRVEAGLCVALGEKNNCIKPTEDKSSAENNTSRTEKDTYSTTTLDSGYITGPDPTTPSRNSVFSETNFYIGDNTETGGEPHHDDDDDYQTVMQNFFLGNDNRSAVTQPIAIPVGPQSRSTRRPRHPDHTPPRGYIPRPSGRFSTGCLWPEQLAELESTHAHRTISTQTSVSFSVEQQIQQSIKILDETLQCKEQNLIANTGSSSHDLGLARVRTHSESLTEVEVGHQLTHRDRSHSDPGITLRRLHVERNLGQELRRISDEFHNERLGRGLFRIPEDREDVHSSSFPRFNNRQQGWWHSIIQFVSPNNVRPLQDNFSLPEPETGERQT